LRRAARPVQGRIVAAPTGDAMPELTYRFTPQDLAAFQIHVALRPATVRRWRWQVVLLALALPVVTYLIAWAAAGFGPMILTKGTVLPALLPMAVVLATLPFMRSYARWRLRRGAEWLGRRAAEGAVFGQTRLVTTETGLQVDLPASHSLFAWSAVAGIEETPSHLFVMLGPAVAVVVPKRELDAAALDALRAEVAARRAAIAS
jgi:hypothetical protein